MNQIIDYFIEILESIIEWLFNSKPIKNILVKPSFLGIEIIFSVLLSLTFV